MHPSLIETLRRMAQPDSTIPLKLVGICHNLRRVSGVSDETEREWVRSKVKPAFESMRLHPIYPVSGGDSHEFDLDDLWEGFRGECRRALADCVADVLEFGAADPDKVRALHGKLRDLAERDGRDPGDILQEPEEAEETL